MNQIKKQDLCVHLINQLEACRSQTLSLYEGMTEHDTRIQVDELRGPLVWDLGHCAWFEELWVLRNTFHEEESRPNSDQIFNNELHHKRQRQTMTLPYGQELYDYTRAIRKRTLSRLETTDFLNDNPLLKNGFVFDLILQHEIQHQELLFITLQQLLASPHTSLPTSVGIKEGHSLRSSWEPGVMVEIPGGPFNLGAHGESFAYDNERPAHCVQITDFHLDRYKTTNQEYLEFIEEGGYKKRKYWTDEGWQWIQFNEITCPDYWRYDPHEGWIRKGFGGKNKPVNLDHPVCNISWHEAMAYAKFRGKRLPTEAEWERAASIDDDSSIKRKNPWGDEAASTARACLDGNLLGPAPVWALPEVDSALGLRQMIGNVWEWTQSPFLPYPGFKPFPYPEYSKIFMGSKLKVLKGGSWVTSPLLVRNTFRNFYLPHHRHVIAGIRLAR